MFNNPLNRKFQTGGNTPTDDQKKDMQGFVTWIKSNVEGFKDKSEQEIAKSISDMAKSEEGKKSVQDLYTRYQKSKKKTKFEDGGKFKSFICKHGRGGNVDCGCGGMVIRGEDGIDKLPEGTSRIITPRDTTDTYYLPNGNMVESIHPTDGSTQRYRESSPITLWNRWKTRTPRLQNAIGVFSKLWPFAAERITPEEEARYEEARRATFGTPSKEDGGILKGQDGLSRKQVRQDKREALRAMNRPTAGVQYEDLVNQTRNWDRFAGMSRLERKNAINQLILNREKPIVQTPIQPDLGENYVINETTVPYQLSNPTPQVIETPKVETVTTQRQSTPIATTQRSASTRRSDIAKSEDFPMQEIVIPQISTNIPFGGRKTNTVVETTVPTESITETKPLHLTPRPEDTIMYPATPGAWTTMTPAERMQNDFGKYPLEGAAEWGQGGIYETDSEGNRIIKDEGNGVYWTRDAEGRLQKHEPVRTVTIATSAPRRNYSAISGQPLRNGQSTWDLFKQGGQIEKHQNDNGIIDHYRSKWANDWANIKRGWNNFKDSAFGLIIPTSGEELLMSAAPMGKPIYTSAKVAKAAGKVKITPKVEQGITKTAGGPLLEFEGDLIKIRSGLTPAQREKARKLAYEIADARALRKSLPRDLDDAYGMTNGPWSSTFGRHFKLSELNK